MQTLNFVIFKLEHALNKPILTSAKKRHFPRFSQSLPPDMKAKHCFWQTWFPVSAANCRSVFMFCIHRFVEKVEFRFKDRCKRDTFSHFFSGSVQIPVGGVVIDFVKTVTDVDSYSVGGVLNKLPLHHLSPQQVLWKCHKQTMVHTVTRQKHRVFHFTLTRRSLLEFTRCVL